MALIFMLACISHYFNWSSKKPASVPEYRCFFTFGHNRAERLETTFILILIFKLCGNKSSITLRDTSLYLENTSKMERYWIILRKQGKGNDLLNLLNNFFGIFSLLFYLFIFFYKSLFCVLWLNWCLDTAAIFRKGKFKGENDGFVLGN